MSTWLGRQRKPELIALGNHANLKDLDGLRKEELVSLLDEHFQKHAGSLADKEVFKEYYDRASPAKRASGASAAAASDADKPKRKRAPKVKEESSDAADGPSSPSASLTPAAPRIRVNSGTPSHSIASLVKTFPPSPAVVTDAIDVQTRRVSAGVSNALAATNLQGLLDDTRASLSSVVGVESVIFLLEAFYLQRQIVPWRYAFDIPPIDQLGTKTQPVHVPDFFILLTDIYWSTTLLWSFVSFFVPLIASWLFNLTMRPVNRAGATVQKPRWRCDPCTFNVVKALTAWLVYTQKFRFWGLFADDTVLAVSRSMPAGYPGVMIGAAIGILASVYDAAQRK